MLFDIDVPDPKIAESMSDAHFRKVRKAPLCLIIFTDAHVGSHSILIVYATIGVRVLDLPKSSAEHKHLVRLCSCNHAMPIS